MTQGRDDYDSGQVGCSGCSENWLYSGYVLKIVSKGFADRTGNIHKIKGVENDSRISGQSTWKNGVSPY